MRLRLDRVRRRSSPGAGRYDASRRKHGGGATGRQACGCGDAAGRSLDGRRAADRTSTTVRRALRCEPTPSRYRHANPSTTQLGEERRKKRGARFPPFAATGPAGSRARGAVPWTPSLELYGPAARRGHRSSSPRSCSCTRAGHLVCRHRSGTSTSNLEFAVQSWRWPTTSPTRGTGVLAAMGDAGGFVDSPRRPACPTPGRSGLLRARPGVEALGDFRLRGAAAPRRRRVRAPPDGLPW